ncbi:hypothetical protein CAPTEDRAFT_125077 [Capitella teleta]|uniref:AP complex subunit sigma n=1 Tax=Capitella teleta TaxID=283909 RepID=R7VIB0_CAPTE|nr:hypothetical protein CAPTEDRAFT_125077 [Capitella teleta]|eukprot:ELU18349.1 hypothetical protein CAPTEDRAFT_125077 [Capitella teleta]
MIKFLYLVNKQGQPRILKYFDNDSTLSRKTSESAIIRKCLSHAEGGCSFLDYRGTKLVFRKYATLYFILGVDEDENELAALEFIQNIVEIFDKYFDKVCELDIMFNLDRVHVILDELLCNGCIVEGSKSLALGPLLLMDKVVK